MSTTMSQLDVAETSSKTTSVFRHRRASNAKSLSGPRISRRKGILRFFPDWCIEPTLKTEKGRSAQMMQLIILPIIPVLVLAVNSTYRLCIAAIAVVDFNHVLLAMEHVLELDKLISALQMERSMNVFYIGYNGTPVDVTSQYKIVDGYFESLTTWPTPEEQKLLKLDSKEKVLEEISEYRLSIAFENDTLEVLTFYTNYTRSFIHWSSKRLWIEQQTKLWAQGVGYYYLLRAQDHVGLLHALGLIYFFDGRLNADAFNQFLISVEDASNFINISMQHDDRIRDELYRRFLLSKRANDLFSDFQLILENKPQPANETLGRTWYGDLSFFISHIAEIKEMSLHNISTGILAEKQVAIGELILDTVGLVVSFAFAPLVFLVMRKLTNGISDGVNDILYKQAQAKFEKRKTEELLYQMLPKQVALQLRMHSKVNAESFDEVTVMFSDIKNFTEISNISTPFQIVNLLNAIYNHIDSNLEKYDVYKVETISDVYMVVSGCPIPNGDRHLVEIASLAMELIETTKTFRVPHLRQETLQVRIGMNTGSCVAGVVGEKMPRYCLFGDTINTAARMQTNGLPLKIHMSPSSADLLDRLGGYNIQYRGVMTIKGKGEMKTYWLIGKESDLNHSSALRVGFIT